MPPTAADERLVQAQQLLRQGQLQLGEVLLRQALAEQPRHPGALGLLGQLYQQTQRDDEALACFDAAVAVQPPSAQLQHARGLVLKRLGRLDEALAAYDAALAASPAYFEAHHNRGVALRLLGRHAEAVASARHAVALQPGSADACNGLGIAQLAAGDPAAALSSFDHALRLRPADAGFLNNRGMALHAMGTLDAAAAAFEQALQHDRRAARTWMNLGVVRHEQRRYAEALAAFDAAQQIDPSDLDVPLNRANTLAELGRLEEALATLRPLCDARPRDTEAWLNLANTLRDLQRHAEATDAYEHALTLAPANADVHWNFSLCLLTKGDFARGWPEFEWRWRAANLGNVERVVDAPRWLGSPPLDGKTILLHAEQGLGDTLQMVRYVPVLAAQGARVLLEAQRPLLQLLSSLQGVSSLCAPGEATGPVDFHCPLFSLPLAVGTTLQTVPATTPYLQADPARVERWRPVVRRAGQLQVGLAWSGNPEHPGNARRSLSLAALLDALPVGPRYWCLQKDIAPADLPLAEAGRIHCFDENGFADTAAQIALLDAVVSVDTSIAHLAGALGQRMWILLSHAPDFRWLADRDDSPWYPTARLLRQARPGDWSGPLRQLARDIGMLTPAP